MQEKLSSVAQGVQRPRSAKAAGLARGLPSLPVASVVSRKHTLPPRPLLALGPMTQTQAGQAGERCLEGDSTETQPAVTRISAYHVEDARWGAAWEGQGTLQHTAGPTIGRSGHGPMGWSLRSQSGAPGSPSIHKTERGRTPSRPELRGTLKCARPVWSRLGFRSLEVRGVPVLPRPLPQSWANSPSTRRWAPP